MTTAQVATLITLATPFVVPVLVAVAKQLPTALPSWTLPILAVVLGAAIDGINQVVTGQSVGVLSGAALGAAGIGVREVVDQLSKGVKG
jgi:hypothetical protein